MFIVVARVFGSLFQMIAFIVYSYIIVTYMCYYVLVLGIIVVERVIYVVFWFKDLFFF